MFCPDYTARSVFVEGLGLQERGADEDSCKQQGQYSMAELWGKQIVWASGFAVPSQHGLQLLLSRRKAFEVLTEKSR